MATIKFINQPLDRSYTVTSKYGYRTSPSPGYHSGIDLDVNDTNPANIYAVNSGRVITASFDHDGYGYYTVIAHDGYCTLYAHMKGNNYTVGQVVSAGAVLGVMGSTGNSTGDHLHLEVRIGEANNFSDYRSLEKTDPAPYLSGGTYAIKKDISTTIPTLTTSGSREDMSGGEAGVLPQTLSNVTSQPIHAFIKIFLGDDLTLLSTDPAKPNIFQSFEYTRYDGVGEESTLTLFDTNWDDIEYYLARNHDKVYIQYGYYGMEGRVTYPIRKHRLSNYSLSFVNEGTIISISTITEGAYQNLNQTTIVLDRSVNKQNPTEFVKAVCLAMGWTVLEENFDASSDIDGEPLDILNDYPVSYIVNNVVPLAAEQNEEAFYFYLDADGVAYFKRYNVLDADKMKTYVYQKGYNTPVVDLSFDIKGVFGGTSVGFATGLRGDLLDPATKSEEVYKINSNDVRNVSYGSSSDTAANQSTPSIDVTGDSPTRARRKLNYYLYSDINSQYTANMTILGDPTIELLENVRIINITDSGNLHHTSGVYWVKGITDSITDGKMLTTLELARNARADIDGIELLNPKFYIK